MPKSPSRLSDTAALVNAPSSDLDYASVREVEGGFVVSTSKRGGEYREHVCTEKPTLSVSYGEKGSGKSGSNSLSRAVQHAKR